MWQESKSTGLNILEEMRLHVIMGVCRADLKNICTRTDLLVFLSPKPFPDVG